MIDQNSLIEASSGIVAIVGGLYTGIRRLRSSSKAKKIQEREEILLKAMEGADKIREELETKIKIIEMELKNQKESMSKELHAMRDSYNSEIRILGQRIQELKEDLSQQHQSLVGLLTTLVNSR